MVKFVHSLQLFGGGNGFEMTIRGVKIEYRGQTVLHQVVLTTEEAEKLELDLQEREVQYRLYCTKRERESTMIELQSLEFRYEQCPTCFWVELDGTNMKCGYQEWPKPVVASHLACDTARPAKDLKTCPEFGQ